MAAAGGDNVTDVSCDDFAAFQAVLRQMRTIDDRVIHALNVSLPTASFASKVDAKSQCKQLFEELLASHKQREDLIKKCINKKSTIVNDLRSQREHGKDDAKMLTSLRKQQSQLRLMQGELNVEEVVQDTTNKVFYERCRLHYVPPSV